MESDKYLWELLKGPHVNKEKLMDDIISRILPLITTETLLNPQLVSLVGVLENIIRTCTDENGGQINEITENICFPLLHKIHPTLDSRSQTLVLMSSVGSLQALCAQLGPTSIFVSVLDLCLKSLDFHVLDKTATTQSKSHQEIHDPIDVTCALEVMKNLLKTCMDIELQSRVNNATAKLDRVFEYLLTILRLFDKQQILHITTQSVILFLKSDSHRLLERLEKCWSTVESIWKDDSLSSKSSMLLCSLANYFLPAEGTMSNGLDIGTTDLYWSIIQAGMSSEDTLERKRSIYLLKRTVDMCEKGITDVTVRGGADDVPKFHWTKHNEAGLTKVWGDLIMLVETLEEKQLHVIKPLLPRMQTLVKATSLDQGLPLLHTSWLTALIKRALKHESITVMRWAAETVLYTDLELCPLLHQSEEKYICGDFLLTLQDAKNFSKPQDALLGTASKVAVGLTSFFTNCWTALKTEEKRVSFFRRVFDTLSTNSWGPLPYLFLCKGLSVVPPSLLLDRADILKLRKTLKATLPSLHSYLRGAVQCYFAEALVNLVDTRSVLPRELAAVLSVFSINESLQRGTTLWKKVVSRIQSFCEVNSENWTCLDIQNYVQKETTSFLQVSEDSKFLWSELEAVQVARFTLLAVDAKVLPLTTDVNKPQPSLSGIVGQMTEVVNTVTTRPYMPAHKAERAIELLLCFMSELGTLTGHKDDLSALVREHLVCCRAELLLFIQQRMAGGWRQISDLPSIELGEEAVSVLTKSFHDNSSTGCFHRLVQSCIQTLRSVSSCPQVSMEGQIQFVGAGAILGSVASVYTANSSSLTPSQHVIVEEMYQYTQQMDITLSFPRPQAVESREEWGRISSQYLSNQWKLHLLCLTMGRPLQKPASDILDLCLESLPLAKSDTVLVVFRCVKFLLPLVTLEGSFDKVTKALELTWSLTQEDTRGTWYLTLMEDFVVMAFQPALLRLPADSPIIQKLVEYAEMLLQFGEEKNGLYHVLASHLCSVWSDEDLLPHMAKFFSVMVSTCMYGTIHKRQEKQTVELNAYLQTLGPSCSVNEIMNSVPNDASVRVSAICLLLRLQTTNPAHRRLVQGLIDTLIDRYRVVSTSHKGTTFPNSMAHRQKNRAFQFLLLLEPFIEQENVEKMWMLCLEVMGQTNQPSVRNLVQWLMLRLTLRLDHLVSKLGNQLVHLDEKNTVVICSLLCTMALLGPHLHGNQQLEYYKSAVSAVLPWCMAHHFNTRIHAQVAMLKMWSQCRHQKLTQVLTYFPFVDSVTRFIEDGKHYNSTKNLTKLMENFFLKDFDFERDFSVETMFYTVPQLACMMDDEWIPPQTILESQNLGDVSWIPILNTSDSLSKSDSGTWRIADTGTAAGEEGEDEENGDVQKKIMPWRLMTPDDEAQEELDFCKKRHQAGGLVLVTSLIDKLPNLGGLCRTSEIFGVSEFVIGKIKYLEDKVFQTLSVTAQKWLPVTEVYKTKLETFLMEKKQAGYTLVGVEQTANSISLTDFSFPHKSLLLLGNEREGIPVELINMLDVCVEIPQQGIIRSLNVHVSGALLVWEYRRQQLVNGSHNQ